MNNKFNVLEQVYLQMASAAIEQRGQKDINIISKVTKEKKGHQKPNDEKNEANDKYELKKANEEMESDEKNLLRKNLKREIENELGSEIRAQEKEKLREEMRIKEEIRSEIKKEMEEERNKELKNKKGARDAQHFPFYDSVSLSNHQKEEQVITAEQSRIASDLQEINAKMRKLNISESLVDK